MSTKRKINLVDMYIVEIYTYQRQLLQEEKYEKGNGRSYSDKPTIGEDLSNLENLYLIF